MDGVAYYKKDLGKLSTKILEKCNWRQHKCGKTRNCKGSSTDINENPESVCYKSGKGKLMFTKGMTISEFEQKYNL